MTDETQDAEVNEITSVSLDDAFKDEKAEATPAADESKQVDKETKDDKKSEETTAETTAAEESESVPRKALLDERRKRQEAERKIQELSGKTETKETPDVFEDSEGFKNAITGDALDIATKQKIELSFDLYRENKPDFEEKLQEFLGLFEPDPETGKATKNSHLVAELYASPNPARFAYEMGKDSMEFKQFKSPEYLDKLKAELREEILQELKGKKPSATNLPDLSKATASGKNSEKVAKEVTLDDAFEGAVL